MEQQWVESQEYEANAYRVGQEKDIPECPDINPGGNFEYWI